MEKAKKTALTAAYGAETLAVAVLLLLAAAGPKCVLFPDAMLPMDIRELASAWLGIGFLPVLLVSMPLYKAVRRRAVFAPAGICLLAMLFWVSIWIAGIVRSPVRAADGDIILPEAKEIESVHLTGSELDVTISGSGFAGRLLESLSHAKDTGQDSVQDIPQQKPGLVRIDLNFYQGGTGTVFLYQEDGEWMVEQPFRGIFRLYGDLDGWLRMQIA